jgi:muramoyltetrapeptide carboxypeptidase
MIKPPGLKSGDLIGIVAPARKIKEDEISRFLTYAENWGLRCKFGKNLFGEFNQFSGTDEERAADLQDMINDKEVKAIIFARGGYGSFRTLQMTDFSQLENNPKWIAGFSDITVFHSYINKFLGIETIHSMMPLNFTYDAEEESIDSFRKAIFGESLSYEFDTHPLNIQGSYEGEIAGGNLSVICSLNGTVVFPDLKRKILFIEDVDEYLYHIDRMPAAARGSPAAGAPRQPGRGPRDLPGGPGGGDVRRAPRHGSGRARGGRGGTRGEPRTGPRGG